MHAVAERRAAGASGWLHGAAHGAQLAATAHRLPRLAPGPPGRLLRSARAAPAHGKGRNQGAAACGAWLSCAVYRVLGVGDDRAVGGGVVLAGGPV